MIRIGVDPGVKGSIVGIDENKKIILKTMMPVFKSTKTKTEYNWIEIYEVFRKAKEEHEDIFVMLEQNLILPISGRQSIASTSYFQGFMIGILTALKIPYDIVKPSIWMKAVYVGVNRKDTKIASIQHATRLYPNEDFRATERSKNISDGLTDALGLALYCYDRTR